MKKYDAIIFDADDTLLDFKRSERHAFGETAAHWGLESVDALYQVYTKANQRAWEMFELGEITKERLVIFRFEEFFRQTGLDFSAEEWNAYYKIRLGLTAFLLPGAIEVLEYAVDRYPLYLATNGLEVVQQSRIDLAGIRRYFKDVFTSEALGAQKPQRKFFDKVFAQIDALPENTLLIGDSLTSDIIGGIEYGIDTCYLNFKGKDCSLAPTYELTSLSELLALFQKLG